jgi:nondiscriminating glutamyl-tRNA synthetase
VPLFGIDPVIARANEENAAVFAAETSRVVLAELAKRVDAHAGHVTPAAFKAWLNEIKSETGIKGPALFHPVRIALTGTHSGPEFDKIIPLIEEGAALGLGMRSVRERVDRFVGA